MTWEIISPGTWVIFAVVGLPVYTVLIAWFVGKPGTVRKALMGVVYLVGLTTALWVGLYIQTVIIGLTFPFPR